MLTSTVISLNIREKNTQSFLNEEKFSSTLAGVTQNSLTPEINATKYHLQSDWFSFHVTHSDWLI